MFDEMWNIPKLYITACSSSVQLVPLPPILISILFHQYKELKECMAQVKQISTKVKGLQRVYLEQSKLFGLLLEVSKMIPIMRDAQ
jgi:hypothetical protein